MVRQLGGTQYINNVFTKSYKENQARRPENTVRVWEDFLYDPFIFYFLNASLQSTASGRDLDQYPMHPFSGAMQFPVPWRHAAGMLYAEAPFRSESLHTQLCENNQTRRLGNTVRVWAIISIFYSCSTSSKTKSVHRRLQRKKDHHHHQLRS